MLELPPGLLQESVALRWRVFNPVLIFDVSVPSLLFEEMVANIFLNSVVVLVLDMFDHKFVTAETLTADFALEFLVMDAFTVIDTVLSFELLKH